MTNAVVERTDATTETKADSVVETKDETTSLVTDDSAKTVQTDTDAGSTSTDSEADPHAEKLEADAKAAEAVLDQQRIDAAAAKQVKDDAAKDREAKRKQDVKNQRVTSLKDASEAFDTLANPNLFQIINRKTSEEISLNSEDRKLLVGSVEKLALVAEQAEQMREAERIRTEIDTLFPEEDKQSAFWKDVETRLGGPLDDTKPLPIAPILEALLDARSESAPAVVKLKTEHAKALKAEYDKGKAETLRQLEAGTLQREVSGGNASHSSGSPSSLREAQEWHADSSKPQYDNAWMRAYKASHGIA